LDVLPATTAAKATTAAIFVTLLRMIFSSVLKMQAFYARF
jgi:hypothetical protein